MTDTRRLITRQINGWRKRMAGDAGEAPGLLMTRAYSRRRWPTLAHDEREEILSDIFQTQQVGAAVLQFGEQK